MSEKDFEYSADELVKEVFGEEEEIKEELPKIEEEPKLKKWSESTQEERNRILGMDDDEENATSEQDWIRCILFVAIGSIILYVIEHI